MKDRSEWHTVLWLDEVKGRSLKDQSLYNIESEILLTENNSGGYFIRLRINQRSAVFGHGLSYPDTVLFLYDKNPNVRIARQKKNQIRNANYVSPLDHLKCYLMSITILALVYKCRNFPSSDMGLVAQWITRLTTDQKIPGSNPGKLVFFVSH